MKWIPRIRSGAGYGQARNDGMGLDRGSCRMHLAFFSTSSPRAPIRGPFPPPFPSPRAKTRGPCRTAEGHRRYFAPSGGVFRRLVPIKWIPDRVRNDGMGPDEFGFLQCPSPRSRTRGPCWRAEGHRKYFGPSRRVFRRLVPMKWIPRIRSGAGSGQARNDGKRLKISRSISR
jgi:hypothetical protein